METSEGQFMWNHGVCIWLEKMNALFSPPPSIFNLILFFLLPSNFRALTRLETLATQANFKATHDMATKIAQNNALNIGVCKRV